MSRTFVACAITAAITACVTAGTGVGSSSATPKVKTIAVGQTAVFAGQDLLCVNEPASGAPHIKPAGVACSSYASPYQGLGLWLTRTTVKVTRPPNAHVLYTLHR